MAKYSIHKEASVRIEAPGKQEATTSAGSQQRRMVWKGFCSTMRFDEGLAER